VRANNKCRQHEASAVFCWEVAASTNTESDECRKLIWKGLYKAQVNVRYFTKLAHRYGVAERYISLTIAITASAGIAKLKFWENVPWGWETLTAITAVLGLTNVTFNYAAKAASLADLHCKWIAQRDEWEFAWARANAGQLVGFDEIKRIASPERELQRTESNFWHSEKLRLEAQDEACDALGVPRQIRRSSQ